jgi:hypothetical protein
MAADAAARVLAGAARLVVDCGGDLHVRGGWDIAVEHPATGAAAATLHVAAGGVATSGLGRRMWPGPDGRPSHHLIDPATGTPAWTGLQSVTARGASTLEAETLAKTALLSGPAGARRLLAGRGGVLVHDDGTVERVAARRVLRPHAAIAVAQDEAQALRLRVAARRHALRPRPVPAPTPARPRTDRARTTEPLWSRGSAAGEARA